MECNGIMDDEGCKQNGLLNIPSNLLNKGHNCITM
jgi:hypothetical protein